MSALKNWWEGREPRERGLLSLLAVLVVLFIVIFAVIRPVQSSRATAQMDLVRAKADMQLVSRLLPSLGHRSGSNPRAPFERSTLITVSGAQGLKLTRVQPGNNGTFAVWIDDAEPQALYGFFETLLSDYSTTLDRVIVSADANGGLSAQFTVR